MLTANRLGDGIVVFLDFEGAWSESLAEAVVARSPDEVQGAARIAAPTTRRTTSWSSPISSRCARPTAASTPIRYRERVRVAGPSILDDVPGYVRPRDALSPCSCVRRSPSWHARTSAALVEAA